ncbi:MAG: hypothetical protein J0I93_03820 [Legionella sp.]|nr:hypothetical protein [Legionella sp.]
MSTLYNKLCSAIANNDFTYIKDIIEQLRKNKDKRTVKDFQKKLTQDFSRHLMSSNLSAGEKEQITTELNALGYVIGEKINLKKRAAPVSFHEEHARKKARIEPHPELSSPLQIQSHVNPQQYIISPTPNTGAQTVTTPPKISASKQFINYAEKQLLNGNRIRIFYSLHSFKDLDEVAQSLNSVIKNLDALRKTTFMKKFFMQTLNVITKEKNNPTSNHKDYPYISSYIKLNTENLNKQLLTEEQQAELFTKYNYETFNAIAELYSVTSFMNIHTFYEVMMMMDPQLILFAQKQIKQYSELLMEVFQLQPAQIVEELYFWASPLVLSQERPQSHIDIPYESPKEPVPLKLTQPNYTQVQVNHNYFFTPPPVVYYPLPGNVIADSPSPMIYYNKLAHTYPNLPVTNPVIQNPVVTSAQSADSLRENPEKNNEEKLQAPRVGGMFSATHSAQENKTPGYKKSNIHSLLN